MVLTVKMVDPLGGRYGQGGSMMTELWGTGYTIFLYGEVSYTGTCLSAFCMYTIPQNKIYLQSTDLLDYH